MDSPAQIDGGSSKRNWIILFKHINYKQQKVFDPPKPYKIDLHTIFSRNFYTIQHKKACPNALKLNSKLKNKSKIKLILSRVAVPLLYQFSMYFQNNSFKSKNSALQWAVSRRWVTPSGPLVSYKWAIPEQLVLRGWDVTTRDKLNLILDCFSISNLIWGDAGNF